MLPQFYSQYKKDFSVLRQNLEYVSIKDKTKLVIRYLNKDKLIQCFDNDKEDKIITYDENYVKLMPDNKRIKYYHSHCNSSQMIEPVYSLNELQTHLGHHRGN